VHAAYSTWFAECVLRNIAVAAVAAGVIDMNQLTAVTSRRRHVTQIYVSARNIDIIDGHVSGHRVGPQLICTHRHGIDKYLDTLLASQTAQKALHRPLPKRVIARWRTVRVIISTFLPNQSQRSSFAVIGYAKAGRRRSPTTCRPL